jgi:PWWP domain
LLKESPPVNTIKPIAADVIESEDSMFASQDSPISPTTSAVSQTSSNFKIGDLIWGATRGCDAWPGKVVNGPDGEPNSSDCVWVKWFGGRQNTEMMLCSTLKSLSEGLEAHHAAQKDTRK